MSKREKASRRQNRFPGGVGLHLVSMEIDRLVFSGHAIQRMFERSIDQRSIREVLAGGEMIEEYPDDTPFPSRLVLGKAGGRPLHVVAGVDDQTNTWYIVTVYEPDISLWEPGFRERRKT
jgi:hypothetical protein